jgi:soluble lytic murein transglycosylase-like protein
LVPIELTNMTQRNTLLWVLGGAGVLWLLSQRDQVAGAVEWGADTVQAAVSGWQTVNQGPQWVPVLNVAENQNGIPSNLLARTAYQESHFRPDIIDGSTVSPAGALGIMQLMPQWFSTVRVSRPFTPQDTGAQIQQAAVELSRLYRHYQDWGLALAAYNDGQGNVDSYVAGNRALPAETLTYVSAVLADVPVSGASIPA